MYYYNAGEEVSQHEFIAETTSDIAKLPTATAIGDKTSAIQDAYHKTAFGSKALCIQTGDLYILTADNQWRKVGG